MAFTSELGSLQVAAKVLCIAQASWTVFSLSRVALQPGVHPGVELTMTLGKAFSSIFGVPAQVPVEIGKLHADSLEVIPHLTDLWIQLLQRNRADTRVLEGQAALKVIPVSPLLLAC